MGGFVAVGGWWTKERWSLLRVGAAGCGSRGECVGVQPQGAGRCLVGHLRFRIDGYAAWRMRICMAHAHLFSRSRFVIESASTNDLVRESQVYVTCQHVEQHQ